MNMCVYSVSVVLILLDTPYSVLKIGLIYKVPVYSRVFLRLFIMIFNIIYTDGASRMDHPKFG